MKKHLLDWFWLYGNAPSQQFLTSIGINELTNAYAYIARTGVSFTLNTTSATGYNWQVLTEQENPLTSTLQNPTFQTTGDTTGIGSAIVSRIVLEKSKNNTLKRAFTAGVFSRPDTFEENEADVVFDLSAVQAGTFSNPLGDANISGNGTNNFAYDFNDVSRPGLKIYVKGSYSGRINFTGLRGTALSPVRIQCPTSGQATFTATNGSQPYAWQFTTGNQYIEIDGSASATHQFGFKLNGYISSATSGQMLFFSGSAQRGFEIHGVELDGRKNDPSNLATGGGAAIQFQPPTPTITQNATNWSWEYIRVYNCYPHDNFGEAIYCGYFSDAEQAGYRPDRMGVVDIIRNRIEDTDRDGIQVASADGCQILFNLIKRTGQEANISHNSAISWNDGNKSACTIYGNYAEDVDTFVSAQTGGTGDGDYYFERNFGKQRTSPLSGSMNQFLFLKIENASCHYEVINNTFICESVVVAPVCIQHDNSPTYEDLTFQYKGNAIVANTFGGATWPELRVVNSPSSTASWTIDNQYATTTTTLGMGSDYKTNTTASILYGQGYAPVFDYLNDPDNACDLEGYLLNQSQYNIDFTAGCYMGFEQYINHEIAPVISGSTSSVADTTLTLDVTSDEYAKIYYVFVANGDPVPSNAQIIAGQNSTGAAALKSGTTNAKTAAFAVTGLTQNTAYDIHIVAVDPPGNQSDIESVDVTTAVTINQVTFEEAAAGVNRATTGTLTPAYPTTGIQSGDLLVIQVSIRATGGAVTTPTGDGFELISSQQMGSTDQGRQYLFGKIATGSESGTVTISFSSDFGVSKLARMYRFRNNVTSSVSNAIESLAGTSATGTAIADVGVTSTGTKSLAVNFFSFGDDITVGAFTGQTGGTWVEPVEEYTRVATNGGTLQLQSATLASAGTINGGTLTASESDPWSIIGFVIKPV